MARPSKQKWAKQRGAGSGKRKPTNAQRHPVESGSPSEQERPSQTGVARPAWALGIVTMLISAGASGMLVMQHFTGMGAPGCGPGSACAQAAESVWGRVPMIDWPISFLGLSYFVAALVVWIITRGMIGRMIWFVRLGALASAAYVVIMLFNIQDYLCVYCMVSHAGNFAFFGVAEWSRRSAATVMAPVNPMRPLWQAVAGVAAVTVVLASWQAVHQRTIERESDIAMMESTERIIEAGVEHELFSGRFRLGPNKAPIRVVVFSGYQCPECQRLEHEMSRIMRERDDVSFSIKHFPLNPDCNPHAMRRIHGDACWSARAVEAAGILRGETGYWQMHHWLVQQRGTFTRDQLNAALRQFDFPAEEFIRLMVSDETLELVEQDADEAWSLGIQYTPMVFINGVELRGTHASRRIREAIVRVAAQQPEAQTPAADRPISAVERSVDIWRESQRHVIEAVDPARSLGPIDAPVTIHFWGDYAHTQTRKADARIRELMQERTDLRYDFRAFPLHADCNPVVQTEQSESGCFAARLAHSAAIVAGRDGYWRMHAWLMNRGADLNEADLERAAREAGIEPDVLRHAMNDDRIDETIAREARMAEPISEQRTAPMIFINGKWLPRWEFDGQDVLQRVVDEAAQSKR